MGNSTLSSTKTLKSSRFLFISIVAMALVIFVNPNYARSSEKLMVQDASGNIKFGAGDDGTIMLNSNTFNGPSWALMYGSSNNNNTGYAMDSYESPVLPATYVTRVAEAHSGSQGALRCCRLPLDRETGWDFSYSADMTGLQDS